MYTPVGFAAHSMVKCILEIPGHPLKVDQSRQLVRAAHSVLLICSAQQCLCKHAEGKCHTAVEERVCIYRKLCHAAQIAALAVALKYAASPEFKTYAKQVSSDKQASQAVPVPASDCAMRVMLRQTRKHTSHD